jgi:hypothetical protein
LETPSVEYKGECTADKFDLTLECLSIHEFSILIPPHLVFAPVAQEGTMGWFFVCCTRQAFTILHPNFGELEVEVELLRTP